MPIELNQTHNPTLKSWIDSANDGVTDFPIQNLPFGIFRSSASNEAFRGGIAIGDKILDLTAAAKAGVFSTELAPVLDSLKLSELNDFMQMGPAVWSTFRAEVSALLSEDSPHQETLTTCLVDQAKAEYQLPARIGDYTDFYSSINHATNVGKLFRPDNPLLPNYQWVPIGYHGRSSSIMIDGHSFPRPYGQLKSPDAETPVLAPCQRLDYELEVGIYIGPGNSSGSSIALDEAEHHVFGLCVFNDWSARDIQAWEYQPLGPFLSKSFASTVSPWIVTTEALAPFRTAWTRPQDHPQPLPYLDSEQMRSYGGVDMALEVLIQTPAMQASNQPPERLALSNFKESYWTMSQMVAHHSVNGCNLRPGDLLGSGTQSGVSDDSLGALLEATQGGKHPVTLSNGETRTFLEDGDTITLRGWCESPDAIRIGFGKASATVLPAMEHHNEN